jgi:two-component system OmpR family response regulator
MIYLVEDNEALRSSLIAMLREFAQLEVGGSSGTEQEATDWLHAHAMQWRLAVVDLFLLQGSGLGVVSSFRQRQPWQKIVVLTNYATPDIRRRALALGADAVFDKGRELDDFLAYCGRHAACPPQPCTSAMPSS